MAGEATATSVTFTLSEADLRTYYALAAGRQRRGSGFRESIVSAIFAPLALAALLMAWAAYKRLSSDDFGFLLIVGGVAYLTGVFALRYEIGRNLRRQSTEAYLKEPLYSGERRMALLDDGFEFALPLVTQRYRYAAVTEVRIERGLVLAWMGLAGVAVPVTAFTAPADAVAFADALRQKVDAGRNPA